MPPEGKEKSTVIYVINNARHGGEYWTDSSPIKMRLEAADMLLTITYTY